MYDCAYSASLEIPAAHIQTGQQMRQIAQPPSYDVTHTALVLKSPVDLHQLRIEQLLALALTKIGQDNHIHHPVLVLKCYEDHTAGGRRLLPAGYQTRDGNVSPMPDLNEIPGAPAAHRSKGLTQ